LTRLGTQSSGVGGSSVTFSTSLLAPFPRASVRISPTHNLVDDFTWIKGKHSFNLAATSGSSLTTGWPITTFPSYSYSLNTLKGLGKDMTDAVTAFMDTRAGSSTMALTEASNVSTPLARCLESSIHTAAPINTHRRQRCSVGNPVPRSFANNEWEFYGQDTWKLRRDLTSRQACAIRCFPRPMKETACRCLR